MTTKEVEKCKNAPFGTLSQSKHLKDRSGLSDRMLISISATFGSMPHMQWGPTCPRKSLVYKMRRMDLFFVIANSKSAGEEAFRFGKQEIQ